MPVIEAPPAGMLYHAVYPGGRSGEEDDLAPDDVSSYENAVGKKAAWVYFSNNWYRERSFPLATATWIRGRGSIPFIRLMLLDSADRACPQEVFTLDRIIRGDFDADLIEWARDAKSFATPLLVEFGTEVNGDWFPWNGRWNGGGKRDGYGDPTRYDGPERFRDAYRHVVSVVRNQGAGNIKWVFHANNDDSPEKQWNRLEEYYPGDSWVDWIGVSAYGAQKPLDDYADTFRELMDTVYPRLTSLSGSKPIAVLEFGVTGGNPSVDQAEWAADALKDLTARRWPRIVAFSWWNEKWQNDDDSAHDTDMRVQDNPTLSRVFKQLVGANGSVLGTAATTGHQEP